MSITENSFGTLQNGTAVSAYTLKNAAGASLTLLSYGARIASLRMPDRDGNFAEMVLGHSTLDEYAAPGDYLGTAVGRYANRIAGGTFDIGGKTYTLDKNEGLNTLHGGSDGFSSRNWRCKHRDNSTDAPSITFTCTSPDGDQGFPGTCSVSVTYCLTTDNAVIIDYRAECSKTTYLNLTNHSFFTLGAESSEELLASVLQLNADSFLAADDSLLPTGKVLPVDGTAEDFRSFKPIGQDIAKDEPLLHHCGGYDHCFVLNGTGMRRAAEVCNKTRGIRMLVFTDQPGMQLYTANSFGEGSKGRDGSPLLPHTAVCLETQHFPDSPHHPQFPSALLPVGKTFRSRTVYKFEAENC
ncbi:MAG: galactose mutarotase [Oscillospiraceae bacterium]|jgi:aldose 1-epimerase|nr:galactose mutarotase [Oscillospiraceae bacterium]MDD3261136.1 galactose mutarotase [Oscillospiraceae bacterium]